MAKIIITTTRPSDEIAWYSGTLLDQYAHSDNVRRLELTIESKNEPPKWWEEHGYGNTPSENYVVTYKFLKKVNQFSGTVEALQEYIAYITRDDAPQKIYNDSVGIVRTISEITE